VEVVKEDTPLYFYANMILAIINGTFNSTVADALMEESSSDSEWFRTFEKLLVDRSIGLKGDSIILESVYELLMQLAHHLTNGDTHQVVEAVDNIEALQNILSKGKTNA
jgi:signal peptidase I